MPDNNTKIDIAVLQEWSKSVLKDIEENREDHTSLFDAINDLRDGFHKFQLETIPDLKLLKFKIAALGVLGGAVPTGLKWVIEKASLDPVYDLLCIITIWWMRV